jgi:hypothetical protein
MVLSGTGTSLLLVPEIVLSGTGTGPLLVPETSLSNSDCVISFGTV